jgi:hypothetical protein
MEQTDNMVWVFRQEAEAEYRLACIYSLAIETIAETRKPDPLTMADQRLQNRYRNEAIRCLQFAHDGGFSDFFQTNIDSDLSALRDDPRMKEFEATHSYQQGMLEKKRGEAKKASAHFEKADSVVVEFLKALPGDSRQKDVRIIGLCAQVQLGQAAEAIKNADELKSMLGTRDRAVFRLARVYSLASATAGDAKLQEEYRTTAFALLDQAADDGLKQALLMEEDLEPIRGDPRFEQTLRLYTEKEKKR